MILFSNNLLNKKNKLFFNLLNFRVQVLNILCLIQHYEQITKIKLFIS